MNPTAADVPNSRLIRGGISIAFATITGIGLSLLGTIIAARHFSAGVYGAFVLLQVSVSFLSMLSGLGFNSTIAKFVAKPESEQYQSELVSTAVLSRLAAIALTSMLAWLASPLLTALFGSSLVADVLVFAPVLLVLQSTRSLLRFILQGFFLFSTIAVTDFLMNALNLVLLIIFIVFFDIGILALLLPLCISLFAACVAFFVSIPVRKTMVFRVSIFKSLFAFSFPLQLNEFLTYVFTRADTFVIGASLGTADIAAYEFARKMPDNLQQFYDPFRSVYFPFVSRLLDLGERQKAAAALNTSARLIAFVTILGAVIALLFGQEIIRLMFSDKYLSSAPVFAVLMLCLSITLLDELLGTSLIAVGESNKPVLINVVHSVVTVAGNLLLVPSMGIMGAAIASLLGFAAANPLNVFFLRKHIDVRMRSYLKPVLIYAGWAVLAIAAAPRSIWEDLGFLVLFLLPCAFFSVITKEDALMLLTESQLFSWRPLRRWRPAPKQA